MTRYEELMMKAETCLKLAKETEGFMSQVWENHSRELVKQAKELSWDDANKIVRRGL